MKFIRHDDIHSKNVLNIRELQKSKACPYCNENRTLICHGYSHGYAENVQGKEIRRLRFFALIVIIKGAVEKLIHSYGIVN